MNKLVTLLNEYDGTPTEWKQIGDKIYFDGLGGNSELHELIIISKYYEFIKRLVENDKIDESKIEIHWFSFYESVLMELAIQDSPIEFLISILR